ncbi:WD domain, G-beta repeat [Musa troglodytarum]|uniref:WD domain, G-beta repeat n=1 Tax=Musa troglodytarum TaxID=320322 RepID=A0A9E7JBJ0_9LILI|nr:WD domain, G-beta repeat [Musa troglodytarum]
MVNETCGCTCIRSVELNEGEDVFFDSLDYFCTSFDPESYGSYLVQESDFEIRKFPYEFWMKELPTISVRERRNKFLRETGFDKLILSKLECTKEPGGVRHNVPLEQIDLEMNVYSLLSPAHGGNDDSTCSLGTLVTEKNIVVQNPGQNGSIGMLNEVDSNRTTSWQEIETYVGSQLVQPFLGEEMRPNGVRRDRTLTEDKKLNRRWWRRLTSKMSAGGIYIKDAVTGNSELPKMLMKKVIHENKNNTEITEFCMVQEIVAHKSSIRTMKISPCGTYLATGGEDCVVTIWRFRVVEASHNYLVADGSSSLHDKKSKFRRKGFSCASFVSPDEIFKLEKVPLHEYFGHTSDIVDLSWSKSDCLLSASKDTTVRMWKIGCESCIKVFHHNDCVTCIQFNPVDDQCFISGSIDGKVRIWGIHENRVVDWADTRHTITAISYQTDGKGFVVGTLTGNCRFYVYADNNLQLERELCIWGKKKLIGKQITGLQFCPGDSKKVMITSVDSKVRIFDGFDIVQEFGGSWKSKSYVAASLTSDARYIVSTDENSNICVRDYSSSAIPLSKGVKSIYPCEPFFTEGVTVAVPWPVIETRGAYSCNTSIHSSAPFEHFPKSVSQCQHRDFFTLGSCFSAGGTPRASATWPEEKLPVIPILSERVNHNHMHHPCQRYQESESLVATSRLLIVTGSCSGMVRLFNYSRSPVRLC